MSDFQSRAFIEACEHGFVSRVKHYIEVEKVDPSINDNQAVFIAVHTENLELLQLLMADSRVDPTAQHNVALLLAFKKMNSAFLTFKKMNSSILTQLNQDKRIYDFNSTHSIVHDETGSYFVPDTLPMIDVGDTLEFREDRKEKRFFDACKSGDNQIVEAFIKDGFLNAGVNGNIAVIIAVEKRNLKLLQILMKDPNVNPSSNGNVALLLASQKKYPEIMRELLKDVRVKCANSTSEIKKLLEYSELPQKIEEISTNDPPKEPLNKEEEEKKIIKFMEICQNGQIDPIKKMIDEGVDPSAWDSHAVHIAARAGNMPLLELLMKDPRVDPSVNNNQALRVASKQKRVAIMYQLLKDNRVKDGQTKDALEDLFKEDRKTESQERPAVLTVLVSDPKIKKVRLELYDPSTIIEIIELEKDPFDLRFEIYNPRANLCIEKKNIIIQ
jgi:ankyrin repeat protein